MIKDFSEIDQIAVKVCAFQLNILPIPVCFAHIYVRIPPYC